MVLGPEKEKGEPILSDTTLPMDKAKSLLVLLTPWAMGYTLGCPHPILLLSGSSHSELPHPARSELPGPPYAELQPVSCPLYPGDGATTESQKNDSGQNGQKVGGVVGSPQHGPQHSQ